VALTVVHATSWVAMNNLFNTCLSNVVSILDDVSRRSHHEAL
jgi:hypothetical protein